jgi:hypothetical protein
MLHRFTPLVFGLAGAGIVTVALAVQPTIAAVLPLSVEQPGGVAGGPQEELLTQSLALSLAGEWSGHTPCGSTITIELHAVGRELVGLAKLQGLGLSAPGSLPVTPLVVGRQSILFTVPGRAGVRSAYGVITFVSGQSMRLDLQGGRAPITLTLSRVG